ncbi:tectonin domain-containing protein [Adonisia turfae]
MFLRRFRSKNLQRIRLSKYLSKTDKNPLFSGAFALALALVLLLAVESKAQNNLSFLHWPVPSNGSVACGYGCYENHVGIDVGVSTDNTEPIYAAADGTVVEITDNRPYGRQRIASQGFGNYVKLKHIINNSVYYTWYAHLSSDVKVSQGDYVSTGDLLGYGSNSGYTCGTQPVDTGGCLDHPGSYWHLHFQASSDCGNNSCSVDPFATGWWRTTNNQPVSAISGGSIYKSNGNGWDVLPGFGRDIDVGADGSAWLIGSNAVEGGYGIYQWNGSDWNIKDGGAVRIAVDPDGNPWIVNSLGTIYKRVDDSWQAMPGRAKDIDIGADGSVWVIGVNILSSEGYGIYKWNGSNWSPVDGAAVRVAVDSNGEPWVVNANGNIFRRVGNSWQPISGRAKDIAAGATTDSIWLIGTNPVPGGYGIYQWNGSGWVGKPGGAVKITVDENGTPWATNSG